MWVCCVVQCGWVFLFFKQKTAYEMLRSLVGSEMCIRDRDITDKVTKALNNKYRVGKK